MVVLGLVLVAGFAWYERERPPSRVLALVATLAALAVVGRVAFAAVPNVKPTTDIVLFAGYALGAVPGFAVGAVTAVASNVFLSQGPWTPWQMAGWGGVGVAGALLAVALRGREPNRLVLAAVCGAAGLAFGAWMDLYQLTLAARQDLDTYLAISASSLPYNVAHAVGNVVFCLLIGPAFVRGLRRYRRRLDVRWRAATAASATGALLLLLLLGPAAASAASPSDRAERWLLRAQNADGGFGGAPGQSSGPLFSGWSALGLASAGHNPRDVRRRDGRSLASYVAAGTGGDVGETERSMLVLKAAGLSPRRLGGRDLVAAVLRRRRANGSIAGYVSYTAFGVLALKAAGVGAGGATVDWLLSAQNDDGGFGLTPSSPSDSDMTGATLQALAVVGRTRGAAAGRAVAWLRSNQNRDGGFGQFPGRSSNAQSTSYAVQGLLAARAGGAAVSRALAYLRKRQRADGSIAYSASSTQTPVWVTAQALMALERRPLPLAAVPRRDRRPDEPPQSAAVDAAPSKAPPAGSAPAGKAAEPAPAGGAASAGGSAASPKGAGAAEAQHGHRSPVPRLRPAEPDSTAAGDGGALTVDRPGAGADRSGGGGPRLWLVGLLVALVALALVLVRRRPFAAKLRARLPRRGPA